MKKLTLGLSLIALFLSVPLSSNQAAPQATRYRFFLETKSRSEVRRLAGWLNRHEYDVAGVNLRKGLVEVLTDEAGVEHLKTKGLRGRLTAIPVAGGKNKNLTFLDPRYLDPEKVGKRLRELNERFPKVTRVVEIGRSLKDRPILAMVVSTTPDIKDPEFHEKPTVLFDGMHHAREVMTPEIVIDIAESILVSAKRVKRARFTLENMNVVIVPMLNVDGNALVWSQDNMWRKNARGDGGSVFGVDINRNYTYKWDACDGSSGSRGAQDYRGPSAGSEPETRALMELADRIRPMGSISYHSYSELVLYPFGCDGDLTGENELVAGLGKAMADMLPGDSGGKYTAGTPWQILYAVDGDSMGYMFANFGAVSYVFEVNEEFQPSYELREPTLKKHRVAWQYFLDQARTRLLSLAVRDRQGRPVDAEISIAQIPHRKGERAFATNAGGNYFKMLLPGAYSLEAKTKNGLRGRMELTMGDKPANHTLVVE